MIVEAVGEDPLGFGIEGDSNFFVKNEKVLKSKKSMILHCIYLEYLLCNKLSLVLLIVTLKIQLFFKITYECFYSMSAKTSIDPFTSFNIAGNCGNWGANIDSFTAVINSEMLKVANHKLE